MDEFEFTDEDLPPEMRRKMPHHLKLLQKDVMGDNMSFAKNARNQS